MADWILLGGGKILQKENPTLNPADCCFCVHLPAQCQGAVWKPQSKPDDDDDSREVPLWPAMNPLVTPGARKPRGTPFAAPTMLGETSHYLPVLWWGWHMASLWENQMFPSPSWYTELPALHIPAAAQGEAMNQQRASRGLCVCARMHVCLYANKQHVWPHVWLHVHSFPPDQKPYNTRLLSLVWGSFFSLNWHKYTVYLVYLFSSEAAEQSMCTDKMLLGSLCSTDINCIDAGAQNLRSSKFYLCSPPALRFPRPRLSHLSWDHSV